MCWRWLTLFLSTSSEAKEISPNPGFFRIYPVQSRTQKHCHCPRMPPAKDQAKVPLPTPQREMSHVFTTMPRFSGNYQRTSIKHRLLLAMIYIATLTAARTFLWTTCDPQLTGISYHITISEINVSKITMQPAAMAWLSEDRERQP